MRLDEKLVQLGHANSLSQAKQLIKDGKVSVDDKVVTKPAFSTTAESTITLSQAQKYVGRGAYKIAAAIEKFAIDPAGLIVADVGASTGGFTDYLLQKGAEKIYAIDVGSGQLAEKLTADPRVTNLEGTNIKNPLTLPEKVQLAVVDLSYISLTATLKNIAALLAPAGSIIALIKPQFEAGPEKVPKDGVIKDPAVVKEVLASLKDWCQQNGLQIQKTIPSPITGKEGNVEHLALITSQ